MATEEEKLVASLDRDLQGGRKKIERYDRYYEGEQPLRYMALALEAEIGDRVTQLVVNFPWLGVEAYDHRLDLHGFRCPTKAMTARIHDWWKAIDGDELAGFAFKDSLALSRSYAIVGAGDAKDDPPILTVEDPRQVITKRDPRTRDVTSAIKRWKEDDGTQWAQLYLPNVTVTFRRANRGWAEDARDEHGLGMVPVVPLVNNPRTLRPDGRSEIHDVIPLADAVNKMATDMMVSGEYHAMPRRWALGFTEKDFVDESGQRLSTWSQVAGRIWGSEKGPKEAQLGQFTESDLAVFHNSIRLLAQLIGQMLALPASYVNFTTDNPPSAEGVKASESRTIKRAERKQGNLSTPVKTITRLGDRILTGKWDPKARLIEVKWRDPATPTRAQTADAMVKLVGEGKPIIPVEQAWEELNYTEEQKAQFRTWFEEEARRSLSGLSDLGFGPKPNDPGNAAA